MVSKNKIGFMQNINLMSLLECDTFIIIILKKCQMQKEGGEAAIVKIQAAEKFHICSHLCSIAPLG